MSKALGAESTAEEVLAGADLAGTTVLITGVSSGLGVETARAIAARGAAVIGTVRDLDKAREASAPVREAADQGGGELILVEADLADLASVRSAADKVGSMVSAIDVVIANAGVMAAPFGRTRNGFELQFGTNVLGHFVLVNRLAPLLREGGRLVMLSSSGHRNADVNLDDPNFDHTAYDPWVAYGRSKTGDALIAVAFDERHRARGIRAASVHPGGIQTGLGRHLAPGAMEAMVARVNEQLTAAGRGEHRFKSIPQGAATSVWAGFVADATEIGGRYCENCHVSPVLPDDTTPVASMDEGVRPYALDPARAAKLWEKAEEMVGERY